MDGRESKSFNVLGGKWGGIESSRGFKEITALHEHSFSESLVMKDWRRG